MEVTVGVYVRQNEGYDFAAWAHVLRLHPEFFDAKVLYLLNDSLIGPTNDVAFADLLSRLRANSADVIGLTDNFERGWHISSYFLAFKPRALSSVALHKFLNEIVSFKENVREEVISRYEIRFAPTLKAAGLNCEALFPAKDDLSPTVFHWKDLLQCGFPFIKLMTIRDVFPGADTSGWRELLAEQGYDISLAERTLAEAKAPSPPAEPPPLITRRPVLPPEPGPMVPVAQPASSPPCGELVSLAQAGSGLPQASTPARQIEPSPEKSDEAASTVFEPDIRTIRQSGLFDEFYYRLTNPDLPPDTDMVRHFFERRAQEGRRPDRMFDPVFYSTRYPDVRRSGQNPLLHYFLYGENEGRKRNAEEAKPGSWVPVTDAEIYCLKPPLFGDEAAIFVTHSPRGRLKPYVRHYLDSLERQGIAVILVVNADRTFMSADADLVNAVDGLFVRRNEGYDFAAWAHILLLHPELFDANVLYLINHSMIGPTNDAVFGEVLTKLRNSPADLVGLTENFERGWHIQSYFLALKPRALSSSAFHKFINDIVSYKDLEDVVNEFELRLAPALGAAGLSCEAIFAAIDFVNPTVYHWKQLLQSGFPFVKVKTLRDPFTGVDVGDWREILAAQGFDVSLAERTLAEEKADSRPDGVFPQKQPLVSLAPLPLSLVPLEARDAQGTRLRQVVECTDGVILVDRSFDKAAMDDLMRAADIFASPHCSEGFGLTIAEAMALGKIVVATDYGGSRDFLDARCGFPVRYKLQSLDEDHGHYTQEGGVWAQIDEAHLSERLIEAAERVTAGDPRLGEARRCIADLLSPAVVGARMRESISQLLQ